GVVGVLAPGASAGASAELLGLADARAAAVVERAAPAVGRLLARGTRTSLMIGAGTAALGAVLFVASSPGAGRAAAFWHPLRAIVDARAPVRLGVDRSSVRRGDSVTVTLDVPAATRSILWTRGPGEPWRPAPVAPHAVGHAARRLGPSPGPRHHAAADAQATARDRRAGRSRAHPARSGELAREPNGEGGGGRARVAGRVGRGRAGHRAGGARRGAARPPAGRHIAAPRRGVGQRPRTRPARGAER